MVNKISYVLVFMLFTCAGFIACTDDDKVKITEFTLTLTEPEDLNVASISDLHVTFKNVNTGKLTTNTMTGTTGKITLNEGLYNITVEGKMNYIVDEKTVEGQVKGYKETVNLVGTTSADNRSISPEVQHRKGNNIPEINTLKYIIIQTQCYMPMGL